MSTPTRSFRLAPMSPRFVVLTGVLLAIPTIWALLGLTSDPSFRPTAMVVVAAFASVSAVIWLLLRPTAIEVGGDSTLTIRYPARTTVIPSGTLVRATRVDRSRLRERLGFSMRVGLGGLFGGTFGLLWTTKLGWVAASVTTTDDWVLLERRSGSAILLSVDRPEELVRALTSS